MKKGAKVVIGIAAGLLLGVGGFALSPVGDAALDAYRAGFLTTTKQEEYHGTNDENLRALRTALMLYHDSEGQFPEGTGWMDAISTRLQTADLKPGEGAQKLRHPQAKDGEFGYGLNKVVSGQYVDDLPEKGKTVLLFESNLMGKNAVGDVKELGRTGGGKGITVDGTLVSIP